MGILLRVEHEFSSRNGKCSAPGSWGALPVGRDEETVLTHPLR